MSKPSDVIAIATAEHPIYSYDGTHPNNKGMRAMGLELRRQMCGM